MGTSPALLVRVQHYETPPEDRTPPVISWRYPESGSTVEGRVELGFDALDDDMVDSLSLYINGTTPRIIGINGHEAALYTYNWETSDYADGEYILEVRARDRSGNTGFSNPLSLTVWNNRPRVIWVPDDYEKIQDAINASQDGDTVRVKAGVYEEWLLFWGKNVCIESESGPENTVIYNSAVGSSVIAINEGQDSTTVIRGFTIHEAYQNGLYCIYISGTRPKIVNNILTGNLADGYFNPTYEAAMVRNNLFY